MWATDALAVAGVGKWTVDFGREVGRDGQVELAQFPFDGLAVLWWDFGGQFFQRRPQPPQHLDRGGTVLPDLGCGQFEVLLPAPHWYQDQASALRVAELAVAVRPSPSEVQQKVLDVVEYLDRGGRVVDRR